MATRVNTRFVLVLLLVTICAGGVIGGLWLLQRRGDPTRHIQNGDEFLAAGDFRKAKNNYGRAVGLEPANLAYLGKMEEALLLMQPGTADEARKLYQDYLAILNHAAEHHPTDADRHLRLLDEIHQAARRSAFRGYWEQVADRADRMWERVPASNPKRVHARFHRGAARVTPVMQSILLAEDIEEGEADLMAFVDAVPDSETAWATLIRAGITSVRRLRNDGQTTRADERMRLLRRHVDEARTRVPEGPEVMLAVLRVIDADHTDDPAAVDAAAARQMVQEMVDAVRGRLALADPAPWLVMEAAQAIEQMQWIADAPDPVDLIGEYVDAHPEAYEHRLLRAGLRYYRRELDEVEADARSILDADWLHVGFVSQLQPYLKLRAASLNADVAYQRWYQAEDDERPGRLEALRAARDELTALVSDPDSDPLVTRAQGKVAFAEEDYARAAALFDTLVREQVAVDAETLSYAAIALEKQGQIGRAAAYIEQAVERHPGTPRLLASKARLLMLMHRLDEAAETAAELRKVTAEGLQRSPASDLARQEADGAQALVDEIDRRRRMVAGEVDPIRVAVEDAQSALDGGEPERARSVLLAELEHQPDDLRLLNAVVRVSMAADDRDEARRYVQHARSVAPNSDLFRVLEKWVENVGDPIEVAKEYAAEVSDDEAEQTIQALQQLTQIARTRERRATALEDAGREEEAAEDRDIARRARAEVDTYRARAEDLAPDHRRFIEFLFSEAILARDWAEAERMVERAANLNSDEAGGAFYRGRYELLRGDPEEAVRALRDATSRIPYSAPAWFMLGAAYQTVGNFPEAVTAFESAYGNNPNDIRIVLSYADLLDRTGEKQRALRIVSRGRQLAPLNAGMRNQWLKLEAEVGDAAIVLRERRKLYDEHPEDRANAAALAALLGKRAPARELLLDEDGAEIYTVERWGRLPGRDLERVLTEAQQEWYAESDRIVEELAVDHAADLSLALLRADLLRARGAIDEGEAVLRLAASQQTERETQLAARLALGFYQAQLGRNSAALETYEAARAHQSDDQRDADQYLAELLFRLGRFDEAVEHFEEVVKDRPGDRFDLALIDLNSYTVRRVPSTTRRVKLQIVECLVRLKRLEDARRRLAEVTGEDEGGFGATLLEATIVQGEADALWMAGDTQAADRKRVEFEGILERAIQLSPSDPKPYVMRATNLVRRFHRTGDTLLLDDAMAALGRADKVLTGDVTTGLARVGVLRAKGDDRGAAAELQRILELDPRNEKVRRALVELLLKEGRADAAVTTVADAVDLDPTAATWRETLGDLYRAYKRDPAAAAEQYAVALEFRSSARLVVKLVEMLSAKDPPELERAMELIHQHPDEMEADPGLRCVYARQLVATGQREEALEQMRVAYARYRELIDEDRFRPEAIGNWYGILRSLYGNAAPMEETESFVMDVTGGELDAAELQALASLWRSTGVAGRDRAIELLQQAIDRVDPENTALRARLESELGITLLSVGRYAAAVEVYERVLEIDAENAEALNNLAYLLAELMEKPEQALPYAERAAGLRPSDAAVLDTLGWILFLTGSNEKAESYLRRSVQISPSATSYLHLARVLFEQDDLTRAMRFLARASEMEPDPETQAEIDRLADDIRTKRRSGQ